MWISGLVAASVLARRTTSSSLLGAGGTAAGTFFGTEVFIGCSQCVRVLAQAVAERPAQPQDDLGVVVHHRPGVDGATARAVAVRVLVRVSEHVPELMRGNVARVLGVPRRHVASGRPLANRHAMMLVRIHPLDMECERATSDALRRLAASEVVAPLLLDAARPSVPQRVHGLCGDPLVGIEPDANRDRGASLGIGGSPSVDALGDAEADLLDGARRAGGEVVDLGDEPGPAPLRLVHGAGPVL